MLKNIYNSQGRRFKLGRLRPPLTKTPSLLFGKYLSSSLPTPPVTTDYSDAPKTFLAEILGNNRLGNCTAAAAFHSGGTFLANAGNPIPFTLDDVINFYSATSGYVAGDDSTDNGCDEETVLNYWMQNGLTPGHDIIGWCKIDGTDKQQCKSALWLFENLYFGVELPDAWINPMPDNSGFTWDVAGTTYENNGHAFCGVSYNEKGVGIDTWGLIGTMTWEAIARYTTQDSNGSLYVVLSKDSIAKATAKAPSGFDFTELQNDLQAFNKGEFAMPNNIQGQAIDPGEMVVAKAAVKQVTSKMTYMGVNVGSYVTDAECGQLAAAVVEAIENYRTNKRII